MPIDSELSIRLAIFPIHFDHSLKSLLFGRVDATGPEAVFLVVCDSSMIEL